MLYFKGTNGFFKKKLAFSVFARAYACLVLFFTAKLHSD